MVPTGWTGEDVAKVITAISVAVMAYLHWRLLTKVAEQAKKVDANTATLEAQDVKTDAIVIPALANLKIMGNGKLQHQYRLAVTLAEKAYGLDATVENENALRLARAELASHIENQRKADENQRKADEKAADKTS